MSRVILERKVESQTTENSLEKALLELTARVDRLEQAIFAPRKITPGNSVGVDFGGLTYLKELRSVREMSLALLDHSTRRESNHPGLTPDEIVSILKENFGLPVPLSTVSSALYKVAGKLVTRKKVQGSPVRYRYQILPRGQEVIRKRIDEVTT